MIFKTALFFLFFVIAGSIFGQDMKQGETRPRVREIGLKPGVLPTGKLNSITDVEGVLVGHSTIIEGENIRTGVTAICRITEICLVKKCRPQFLSATLSAN